MTGGHVPELMPARRLVVAEAASGGLRESVKGKHILVDGFGALTLVLGRGRYYSSRQHLRGLRLGRLSAGTQPP